MPENLVIFDCDGGCDDAWALLLLLKAEEERRIKLLGITICFGNTDIQNAARNMFRILKAYSRSEIPIYLGAAESLVSLPINTTKAKVYGKDGFGDIFSEDKELNNIETFVASEHAVPKIKELCLKYYKEVTVIAVGPLTNIALCYATYGKTFAESLKSIFIMGGNHMGIGNHSRAAEFNFCLDPEAAHIVLDKTVCPITILPWEACMRERFFINMEWRLDDFGPRGAASKSFVDMLNKAEYALWIPKGHKNWICCDGLLIAVFLFEHLFVRKQSHWHATVDLSGQFTRGQMVLDHLHEIEKYPKNIRIIELVDDEYFKNIIEWVAGLKEAPDRNNIEQGK